ncbi:MAG: O-acetylhomoserine aminocarboxypropyltransferase/cysteine synthase [Oscillospiraceae bacterium]|nr:O-acetylhomoserine aminocarboxypropyltransferase/cysteine synthase [Oscillospiraceae bacterium]
MKFNTGLLHGKAVGPYANGATLPPVTQSNAFRYDSFETLERVFAHKTMGYAYSRIGNPTVSALEQRINELEGGVGAVAASSGMAAVSMALLTILSPGDEVIAASGLYGGTIDLFGDLEKLGIHTRFVPLLTPEEIEPLITPRTRCIFGEVISNPALRVTDIAAVAELAHSHGLPFLVDSTTATPYLVRPLSLGADIVIHSSSKYITGSGDAISGVIVDGGKFRWDFARYPALKGFEHTGPFAFLMRLRTDVLENFGGCLAPMNAFLNVVGLETLGLRMERICANAAALAKALDELGGLQVNHPTLHEQALCQRQLQGLGGGILTFRAGSKERAVAILNALNYAHIASNIGDVRTLVIHPASTIFMKSTPAQREAAGVFDDTIRVSVGIEDASDLIEDFTAAIRSV